MCYTLANKKVGQTWRHRQRRPRPQPRRQNQRPSKPAAAKSGAKPAAKKAPRAKKVPAPPPEPIPYVSAYEVGNKVSHPMFGDGKVTAIADEQLSIAFTGGDKVVLDSFVKKSGKG